MTRAVVFFVLFVAMPTSLCRFLETSSLEQDTADLTNSTQPDKHIRRKRRLCSDCVCGVRTTHVMMNIYGGDETGTFEFPWIANLWLRDQHHASATIITDRHLISTANTVYGMKVPDFNVIVGMHSLVAPTGQEQYKKLISISYHKDFNPELFTGDIALLKTDYKIHWSGAVRPACLPFSGHMKYDGKEAIVAGWGKENPEGLKSNVLLKATVRVLDNEDCSERTEDHWKKLDDSMICTGKDQGEAGPCEGDVSSPIHIIFGSGIHEVVGLASWGFEYCGESDYPAVYSRITYYLDWIDELLEDTCRCTRRP